MEMKRLLLFLIIALCAGFSSCIKDYETSTYYYVTNKSSHDIEMIVYDMYLPLKGTQTDTTILLHSDGEGFSYYSIYKGKDSPFRVPFPNSDSIEILVNRKLIKTYKPNSVSYDNNDHNPLVFESYNGGREREGLFKYFYSFTDNDLPGL